MIWVFIIGIIGLGLLSWLIGTFSDKYPEAWRQILTGVVVFGGLWLASEADYQTLRLIAFFFPFVFAFAMWLFWRAMDEEDKRSR